MSALEKLQALISGDHITSNNTVNQKIEGNSSPAEVPAVLVEQEHGVVDAAAGGGSSTKSEMPDECSRSSTTVEAAEAGDEQQDAIQEPEKADITTPDVFHTNPPHHDEPSVEASNIPGTKTVDPNNLPINRITHFEATPSLFPEREIGQFEVGLPEERDEIKSIASSSDQSMFAVGSRRGRIILYRFDESGVQMIGLSPPSSSPPSEITPAYQGPAGFEVSALAFSPDNEFLAALFTGLDFNRKLVLFRTKDGAYHSETPVSSFSVSLAFSNTSKQLAIGGLKGCRMFDLEKASLKEDTNISIDLKQAKCRSLSFCPGDDKLLVGTENDGCLLFDSKGLKVLNRLDKGRGIFATAFSPDGMMYAIGTRDSTDLHGTSTGQLIHSFNHGSTSIKFSKDGTRVYYYDRFDTKKIYGYDVISGEKLFERSNSDSESVPFALIGGDSQIVIRNEEVVRIVETAVTLKEKALEGGHRQCYSASMSKDGDIMAICHEFDEVSIYNSFGKQIQKLEGDFDSAFSAKGDKLAIGGVGTTSICSMTKDTDEAGFTCEELFKIDHTSEDDYGESNTQVIFFIENGKDRIASVLVDEQDKCKIVVHSAEEDGKRLHADCITIPFSWGRLVEVVPDTSYLKVWNGNQHEIYHYTDGNVHDNRFNFNFPGDIKQASRFSPDGSKVLVVVDTQLRVYDFSAEKGFNAGNAEIIKTVELSHDDAQSIEMTSHDGKNVVAIAFGSGGIDVIALESDWKGGKALYTIATNTSTNSINSPNDVTSMVFRQNSMSDTCRLIVTCGNQYQSYEISLSGINPTQPFFLLDKCWNEETFMKQCARSSNQKSIPFHRNEDGDTLLQKAFVKGYSKYVDQVIKESPEALLALYSIRPKLIESEEWKGVNSIIENCAKKNEIDQFKQILPSPELLTKFEPSREELLNIVSCIGTLASYNATDALNTILDVSANGCIPGLIPGRKVWFLEPQNKYTSILTKIEDIFKFLGTLIKQDSIKDSVSNQPPQEEVPLSVESQNDEDNLPLVYASRIPPQTSPYNHNLQFMGHEDDEQKRIQLNMCRVLLPNLASMSNLEALLNMEEQYEGDSSSLKLFGKRSLHDSINAAWNSWAQKMFYWQLLYYCTWLISITAVANIRRISDMTEAINAVRISLMCIVSVGWIYFAYLEARQAIIRGISEYLSLSWNLLQIIGLTSTFLFVLMELVQSMGDVAIVCGALSQLFGWVNLLYYTRGTKEVAWVVYALLRIIGRMILFFFILFAVVFACALFIWSMELPNEFGRFDGRFHEVFLDTFFTSFFGDFDPDKDLIDNHFDPDKDLLDNRFKPFTLIFNLAVLVMIPLICLNAMIAFVSEIFADILDDKIAVIAREKANLIMDLYCGMRKSRREALEEENAWTFKLELQSTLNKIDVGEDGEVANKRSTKGDITMLRIKADEETSKIKELTTEMRTEIKMEMTEMKTEMKTEMNTETTEMKKEMKKEMNEMKGKIDEMRAEMTLILQLLQQK